MNPSPDVKLDFVYRFTRVAGMAISTLTVAPPEDRAEPPGPTNAAPTRRPRRVSLRRIAAFVGRHPAVPLAVLGFALTLGAWYLLVDVLAFGRFRALPGPTEVLGEWVSRTPVYGTSLFTSAYYQHILTSVRRVLLAFTLALATGIPLGLLMGWSRRFREHTFPVLELVRPIPILAWVPLAILMFPGSEGPVVFLTFLAAFYATTLNTLLGVQSIDPNLVRAARCLGAGPWDVLRTVVVPGALPYIFTGLQIAMGVAWFSLVAGEMIAGRFGLGYLINESYTTTRYPTIVIAMITLGLVGFASSALIRVVGNRLMAYRRARTAA
jgi:NitT/TauT family transport system permease protein